MGWPWEKKKEKGLNPVGGRGGSWWMNVLEPFAGAWQRNLEIKRETLLANHAVFACSTLIASDIAKMQIYVVTLDANGIWVRQKKQPKVLRRPNHFQNRIQFFENWMLSKLYRGNTYVLKQRDSRGKITALYVLNPDLVTVLVSDSGAVFYQLKDDKLSELAEGITVPASEIIHDRFNCIFHPLCGVSPLFACAYAAYQSEMIQKNSATFFQNGALPGGILSAPDNIDDENAAKVKKAWEENFGGKNRGRVAVLGDGMKYEPINPVTAEQAQMVETLRITADIVCSAYHVPKYKVIAPDPTYNNIDALETQYYSQCLQIHIESIELCLDDAMDMQEEEGTEFDLDGLLRMDQATLVKTTVEGLKGLFKPNEGRRRLNLPPVDGGDTVYMQQQNFSLAALNKRDQSDDPFKSAPSAASAPKEEPPAEDDTVKHDFGAIFEKELRAAC